MPTAPTRPPCPQLSESELERYYPDEYYEDFYEHSGESGRSPLHRLRRRYRAYAAKRRYERQPYQAPAGRPGRVLDVGCGSGQLLASFASGDWETYGIDPSAAATATAAHCGAEVHQARSPTNRGHRARFDLITFQHTLEHILDPLGALERAARLLAPGGLLVVDACWKL